MFIYCLITLFPLLCARKWTQLLRDLKNGGNEWEQGKLSIAQPAWPHLSAIFQPSAYFEGKKLKIWLATTCHRYSIQMCPIAAHVFADVVVWMMRIRRLFGQKSGCHLTVWCFFVIRDTSNPSRAKGCSLKSALRDVKNCWLIWQPKVPILNARDNS